MSSLTGLTERGVQVLYAVAQMQHETQVTVTGPELLEFFKKSALVDATRVAVEGLHQSAATLAKNGSLRKYRTRPVAYEITEHGKALLAREIDVHGRPL